MENSGIYNDSGEAGATLARLVAGEIERMVARCGVAVILFDSAPALAESYRRLSEADLPWTRVIGFQVAEWCGVGEDDPRAGRRVLLDSLVRRVAMAEFHSLRGEAANRPAVCANYGGLLAARWRLLAPLTPLAVVTRGADGQLGDPPLPGHPLDPLDPLDMGGPGDPGDPSEMNVIDDITVPVVDRDQGVCICGEMTLGLTRALLRESERLVVRVASQPDRITQILRRRPGEGDEPLIADRPCHDTSPR